MKESYTGSEKEKDTQKSGLRRTMSERSKANREVTRVVSFTSGKGGVGKTHTVVNLAISLARMGRQVMVLDADLSLANIDVMLGISPRYTIEQVLTGERELDEIVLEGPEGISIIPAASGADSLCSLTVEQRLTFMHALERSALSCDYLLIDTAAGIGTEVMHFNTASSEIICIINDEPTSLTDAYALIKVLAQKYGERTVSVLVNQVSSEAQGQKAFHRLARSVEQFLRIRLKYLGTIPTDPMVSRAIQLQRPVIAEYPSSGVSLAIQKLARKLDEEFWEYQIKGGMQFFFQELLEGNTV